MQNKEPDRLYIKKSDYDDYNRLKAKDSPLNKKDNKSLFLLAVSFGYHFGERETIISDRKDFVRMEYLSDVEKSLLHALAIAEKNNLEVLFDKKEVYTIAEEYATNGLKVLKDIVFSGTYGSFSKNLEADLLDMFETIK